MDSLLSIMDLSKTTILCGDFKIYYKKPKQHYIIKSLENLGFDQLVKEATHIQGGHIDQVYVKEGNLHIAVDVSIYSPYYCAKDHDTLLINVDLLDK